MAASNGATQGRPSALTASSKAPPVQVDMSEKALAAPPENVRALFADPRVVKQIASVLPEHMKPERLTRILANVIMTDPKGDLAKCSTLSLIQCAIKCSELGLEPGSALGLVYLIPRQNKGNKWACTLQVGYRGYIELARRSGVVEDIYARTVHARDEFRISHGSEERIIHNPYINLDDPTDDPGPVVYLYGCAEFRGGRKRYEPMRVSEVEKIRRESPSGNSPAWANHWEEMAKKTVIRRMSKYLPLSPELAKADEVDGAMFTLDPTAKTGGGLGGALGGHGVSPNFVDGTGVVPEVSFAGGSEPEDAEIVQERPPEALSDDEKAILQETTLLRSAIQGAKSKQDLQALAAKINNLPSAEQKVCKEEYAAKMRGLE